MATVNLYRTSDVSDDTSPTLAGNLDAGGFNITNLDYIELDNEPGTDHEAQGFVMEFTAGSQVLQGHAVVMSSDGKVDHFNETVNKPCIGIAMTGVAADAAVKVLMWGVFRDDSYAFTTGGYLYPTESTGTLSHTKPSTANDYVQRIGIAISDDAILVTINPDMLRV